jgi:hypothetical protein
VKEAIQERLDKESSPDSRGFFAPFPAKQILLVQAGDANAPSLRVLMDADVTVEPLANVDALMRQARLRRR